MLTGPLSLLGRTRKSVFQDFMQLSGATMASASETLRPVCCCSIIARPASGFRLGKDDIRSTDSGSAHRCTFLTLPYRRPLQTGRPWSRCSRRWGHESDPGPSWCGTGGHIVAVVGFPGLGRAAKWSGSGRLRTSVRRAIIAFIAQRMPGVEDTDAPYAGIRLTCPLTWSA